MNSTLEQNLLAALDKRKDDPVLLTQFAVSAINYISTNYDLSALNPQTHERLFQGLSSNSDLFWYDYLKGRLSVEDNYIHPRVSKDSYTSAYVALMSCMPEMQYSQKLQERIWNSLERTLLLSRFSGDWQSATLSQKIEYLSEQADLFLDDYDPDCLIHNNEVFLKKNVSIYSYRVKENDTPDAAWNLNYDCIGMSRYTCVMRDKDYMSAHPHVSPIDYSASQLIDMVIPEKFDVDESEDEYHVQINKSHPNIHHVTKVGHEHDSKMLLAHEMCHLICARSSVLYMLQSEEMAKDLDFTEHDFRLHIASIHGYTDSERSFADYLNNREEVLAHTTHKRFYTAYSQRFNIPAEQLSFLPRT